jgi:uncharacterized cupredoxin-like copper-binding protein
MRKRWIGVAAVSGLLLVATACGGGNEPATPATSSPTASGSATGGGQTVGVTEKDFAISTSPTSATAGPLTFDVQNEGPSTHEFVVFKTDLAPDALPTKADGTVDEEGQGVKHIDEIEGIAAGDEATLDVDLEAGSYVLICNLPGHYKSGMHTGFSVS